MRIVGLLNIEPEYVKVSGIDDYRPISSTSFLGRYRVLDFMISNFTNSGIERLNLFVKERPQSTIAHVSGVHYNYNPKQGHILICTGEKNYSNALYNTDLAVFEDNLFSLKLAKVDYVLIAPTHFVYIQDFNALIKEHLTKHNDITLLAQKVNNANRYFSLCSYIETDEQQRVISLMRNNGKQKKRTIYLEACLMSKDLFLTLLKKGRKTSSLYWLKDIIKDVLFTKRVGAYYHRGYVACLNSLDAYYQANLELKEASKLQEIISEKWPIYTLTHDSCPTLYRPGSQVVASAVGNGCDISGKISDSLIGRAVCIGKGSSIEHCLLLPECVIEDNVHLAYAVVDRKAIITSNKELRGSLDNLLYIKKGDRI